MNAENGRQSTSQSFESNTSGRHHQRPTRMPFENTTRRKPRRWPLAFRFIKGSIHNHIIIQVFSHTAFAALVVFCDQHLHLHLGLPQSIIPSLSIVVGLMLVFRNQTSYNRFWEGRGHLGVIITSARNLTRHFLACSYNAQHAASIPQTLVRQSERADTERAAKLLIAILFAIKNHLRGDWGGFYGISSRAPSPKRTSSKIKSSVNLPDSGAFNRNRQRQQARERERGRPLQSRAHVSEFADLVSPGLVGYETRGLGIPLQLTTLVEGYIKRGFERGWWPAPQAAQLSTQLNNLVDAYTKMETIRLTPVPVALLIHQKQVLALFGAVLPFAMVHDQGWWAIPITALVVFTLYGIDGIATQLEDPFGFDRSDIRMDCIVEDIRAEELVLLDEWKRVGEGEGERVDEKGGQSQSRSAEGGGSMEASQVLGASGSLGASTLLDDGKESEQGRRRGEEGGDWFVSNQGAGRMLSWGTVRFEDEF
ncbi:MAG: hypothetical protein MMC23_007815 [Stictis urceolatum]|nr:hypothetical protein [Stictis urceolata]